MKILSIGNSFSVDAQYYLNEIARDAGQALTLGNLYIGGCSLQTHADNLTTNAPAYEYYKNAKLVGACRMKTALEDDDWDFITFQQSSPLSGVIESYEPFASALKEGIRACVPRAEIVWHQTWAYEADSQHPRFVDYHSDRFEMHTRIMEAYARVANAMGARLIPVGEAVSEARKLARFDPERGGKPLTRDGFHLSNELGRLLAGLVWCEFFTKFDARESRFTPKRMEYIGCTSENGALSPIYAPIAGTETTAEDACALRMIAHEVVSRNR